MQKTLRWVVALVAAVAVITSAIILLREPHDEGSPGTKKSKKITVAFNEWVGFGPIFLAKNKGYFGNLEINPVFLASEADKRSAFESNKVQILCGTIDMFLANRTSSDFQGKILFAIDESAGGDGVLASDKFSKGVNLRNAKIATEPGQPAHLLLLDYLGSQGLTLADTNHQDMSSADAATAFMSGKLDVAGTYEPYLSKALKARKGSTVIVSSKDKPGMIVDVAVANNSISGDAEVLNTFYRGWVKAVDYWQKHPDEANAIMCGSFNMTPAEFKENISGLRYFGESENKAFFASGSTSPFAVTYKRIAELLSTNKMTKFVDALENRVDVKVVGN